MSHSTSKLESFGIHRNAPPDAAQWGKVCDLLSAILTNPNLLVGQSESLVPSRLAFPDGGDKDFDERGFPPFFPLDCRPQEDSDSYHIRLKEGYVIERMTDDTRSTKLHMPLVAEADQAEPDPENPGPVPLSAGPKILISIGQTMFVHVHTDEKGRIDKDPEIFLGEDPDNDGRADPDNAKRYQPPPDPGTEGDYYYKIITIDKEDTPDGKRTVVSTWIQSDIDNYHELSTFTNMGGHLEVHSRRDPPLDSYIVRTIWPNYGIEGEQDGPDGGDTIRLDFDGKNVPDDDGGDPGNGVNILTDPRIKQVGGQDLKLDKPAKFRRIAGRGAYYTEEGDDDGVTEQIRVVLGGDDDVPADPNKPASYVPVRVIGNGNVATFFVNGLELFKVEDGLVPSDTTDIEIPVNPPPDLDGWWGTVQLMSGGGKCFGTLGFEDGVLKTVAETGSGDDCVDVPGTEANPGFAWFNIPNP